MRERDRNLSEMDKLTGKKYKSNGLISSSSNDENEKRYEKYLKIISPPKGGGI